MTDPKGAERVARHRAKRDIERLGAMNGWTLVPDATLFVARNGTTIAVGIDGARLPLTLDPVFDSVGDEAESRAIRQPEPRSGGQTTATGKRVYAPKSWAAGTWNHTVEAIRRDQMSKADVIVKLTEQDKGTGSKQLKQALAVIDAMPDTPDWFAGLPVADEPGSEV